MRVCARACVTTCRLWSILSFHYSCKQKRCQVKSLAIFILRSREERPKEKKIGWLHLRFENTKWPMDRLQNPSNLSINGATRLWQQRKKTEAVWMGRRGWQQWRSGSSTELQLNDAANGAGSLWGQTWLEEGLPSSASVQGVEAAVGGAGEGLIYWHLSGTKRSKGPWPDDGQSIRRQIKDGNCPLEFSCNA